jgi:hypothetical protein
MKKIKLYLFIILASNMYNYSICFAQNKITDGNCLESFEDLKSNIEYFSLEQLNIDSLSQFKYFRDLLLKNTIHQYLLTDFKSGNYSFNQNHVFIKNLGYCEIGIFKYKNLISSRQSRDFVIINTNKKKLIICHYDNITFKKNNIIVDFNTRGKHSLEKIIYSDKEAQFVPICYYY